MSRQSVRTGAATLLASLVDGNGAPYFKACYPVMPTRIDKTLLPAAFIMLVKSRRRRRGPMQKHADYTVQARVYYAAPSVGWQTPASPSVLWAAPTSEPQVLFDNWLDDLCRGLEANKSFPQDTPEAGVQAVLIGEPAIEIVTSEPEVDGELVVLSALVTFPAVEQILGV